MCVAEKALTEQVSCGNLCNMCKLSEKVTQITCVTLSWTITIN
jgi:hypothetical protein